MKSSLILLLLGLSAGPPPLRAWTLVRSDLQGWQTRTLTFHVNYSNCPVSQATLDDAIDAALSAWNEIPTASITLVRSTVATTNDVTAFMNGTATDVPLILCDPNFGTTLSVDANSIPGTALNGSASPIVYAGLLLNAQASAAANIQNFSSAQLAIILAHEVGHVLGLGHSGSSLALMYYSLASKTDTVITEDDRDGISYLYPRNEFSNGAFGCSTIHRPSVAYSRFTGWGIFLLWLLSTLLLARTRAGRLRHPKPCNQ